jgi:hypothetical protein
MTKHRALALALATALIAGCGDDDRQSGDRSPTAIESPRFVPARDSAKIDHPLVPLTAVRVKVLETGEERVVSRVLERTKTIDGVRAAVVEVKDYEDGELVEHTFDYYAQAEDGGVWYMGEDVDDLKHGKVVGHGGEWLAGRRGAKPGLFMPADPKVGDVFEQERAPGVAEDRSTVLATGRTVRTPAGTFDDCIRTRDVAPLDDSVEFKQYCAGVGLVSEGGGLELVSYR